MERGPIEKVVGNFMNAMEDRDTENAYLLYSPRAQRQVPIEDLQELLEGNNYFLFKDYESVSIANININLVANANPDLPQGTIAIVNGKVTYENGSTGQFEAILEEVEGEWKLDAIKITIPPNKVQP